MTTGKVSGNLFLIYVDGVAIACSTTASASITNEKIEVTCKDNNGAKTYLLGGQDTTFTVGGIFQFDNVGIDLLTDVVINKTIVTVRFGTDVIGDFFLEMEALISDLQIQADLNTPATYTATFDSYTPVTKGETT